MASILIEISESTGWKRNYLGRETLGETNQLQYIRKNHLLPLTLVHQIATCYYTNLMYHLVPPITPTLVCQIANFYHTSISVPEYCHLLYTNIGVPDSATCCDTNIGVPRSASAYYYNSAQGNYNISKRGLTFTQR